MKTASYKFMCLLILSVLLSFICLIGCSTTRDIYQMSSQAAQQFYAKVTPDQKPLLRKRVLIGPIIDMMGINDEMAAKMKDGWRQFFNEDEYIRVINSNELLESDIKDNESSQYGIILDREQLKMAEEKGINVLVSTVLHPFEIDIRKRGIWPYREYAKIVELSMTVNAFDTASGTLILTIYDSDKIVIKGETKPNATKEWETDYSLLEEKVIPMIEDFSSLISDKLIKYPWQGRISVTGDKKIRINGGKDIGIAQGNVFEVFGKGESIRSFTGREYSIIGQKVGEIRLTKVAEEYSEGIPVSNGQFKDGQIVRIKREIN